MLTSWLSPLVLACVVATILWRPRRLNEAIPAATGAALLVIFGVVNLGDLTAVLHVVSGAGLTILGTILMSAVLDRAGLFRWAALQIARKAGGSGRRLFVLTLMLCFCMTMFFNNDGSVLITTPIIVEIMQRLGFNKIQALPYLVGGCLVASSASAPIGVSNLANLIALSIVGLDLNQYATLMLVPSLLGIIVCIVLLYAVCRRHIPQRYRMVEPELARTFPPRPGDTWHVLRPVAPMWPGGPPPVHPPGPKGFRSRPWAGVPDFDPFMCRIGIVLVVLVRVGFFVGAAYGIPVQVIAITGALVMLGVYVSRRPKGAWQLVRTAPWYVLVFAFGMYTLVYALHKQGLTLLLGHVLQGMAGSSLLAVVIWTGLLVTVMSSLFNNLPSVMIGTVMLTDLHLPAAHLKLAYLASVLGSDIGSLLVPTGTLASLMWLHLVRGKTGITWGDYMRVSLLVIPPSLMLSLLTLYSWGTWLLR
ncbi:MAG: arsenic transporter [Alicyclobacillus shizuokensis]|nr:arsenic transporter [Alicyclobacillus shizuokensis]